MAEVHDNLISFKAQAGVTITFLFEDEYIVTQGQEFKSVTTANNCDVTVRAGRKASKKCAEWFNDFVNGDESRMIHTKSRGNKPKELNFALKGILTINNKEFKVCFGQGHRNNIGNNWHFNSPDMKADSNGKNGYLSDNFRFAQDGVNAFIVTLVK